MKKVKSFRLDKERIDKLNKISIHTKIPFSSLIEMSIDRVIETYTIFLPKESK